MEDVRPLQVCARGRLSPAEYQRAPPNPVGLYPPNAYAGG